MAGMHPRPQPPGSNHRNDEGPTPPGPPIEYIGHRVRRASTPPTRTMVYVQRSRTSVPRTPYVLLVQSETRYESTAAAVNEDGVA